jgi:ketol-acid reductoisomerase
MIVDENVKETMREDPLGSRTAPSPGWILENKAGRPRLQRAHPVKAEGHQIEKVGEKLRAMMPWIQKNRKVNKKEN